MTRSASSQKSGISRFIQSSILHAPALIQKGDDLQMLRACAFALTAPDAVTRPAAILGDNIVFPDCPEMRAALFSVSHSKDFRNGDILRTSFRTVMAGCTGDRPVFINCLLCPAYHVHFPVAQGMKGAHIAQVVFHLLQAAHATQYGKKVFLAGNEADGPAGIGLSRSSFVKNLFHFRDRIRQDPPPLTGSITTMRFP